MTARQATAELQNRLIRNGIPAHFSDASQLRRAQMTLHRCYEFPAARVVEYALGFAVQTRKSGDYLGLDLRPSAESMTHAFF